MVTDPRPVRPYKTFTDYLLRCAFQPGLERNLLICACCKGSGRVIAADEQPDPVEGYKMATRITCSACGGTGIGTKAQHREIYRQHILAWRKSLEHWQQNRKIWASIRSKLTPEERQVVGLQ